MRKIEILSADQKAERYRKAEEACVGLTDSEIFDISYNKHWKYMNFHVLTHSRDLASYVSQVAKKMAKSEHWWADQLRTDVRDIMRTIVDANYIRLDENTSSTAFHKRIKVHNRTLLYLDYLDSDVDSLFRTKNENHSRLITDKQFENITRKSHYLRMCLNRWNKSDKDRWNKIQKSKIKDMVTQVGHEAS